MFVNVANKLRLSRLWLSIIYGIGVCQSFLIWDRIIESGSWKVPKRWSSPIHCTLQDSHHYSWYMPIYVRKPPVKKKKPQATEFRHSSPLNGEPWCWLIYFIIQSLPKCLGKYKDSIQLCMRCNSAVVCSWAVVIVSCSKFNQSKIFLATHLVLHLVLQ